MTQKIDGIEGALEVLRWHVGDDIRITIHSKEGRKFYMPTNKAGATEWINAMSSPMGVQPNPIHQGRVLIRFTIRGDDTVEVVGRDVLLPTSGVAAVFNREQVEKIRACINS